MGKARHASPQYLEQAIRLAMAQALRPGLHHAIVIHHDSCPILNGGSPCTCEPEITIYEGGR
jgi:hypothetical protein